jgi:small conductance mechanosensitive channel
MRNPFSEISEHYFNPLKWFDLFIARGFRILVILAVVFICAKLIHLICIKILESARHSSEGITSEREKRLATVVKIVDRSLRIMIFGAAGLMVLRELGLDITPLLTGAGIVGVAIGFGSQSLVRDMISGFFLLIENQIRVGDSIRINGGIAGTVERMELRVTAIRDGEGTLHTIPNGEIKSVSNMTYEFAQALVSVPLSYRVQSGRVADLLTTLGKEFSSDREWSRFLLGETEYAGITEFGPQSFTVQVSVKTLPHSRAVVSRELRRRIKDVFEREKIEMPMDVMGSLVMNSSENKMRLE